MTLADDLQQLAALNASDRRGNIRISLNAIIDIQAMDNNPLPEPSGTKIVSWLAGNINPATWNAARLAYDTANPTVYVDQADYDLSANGITTSENPRPTAGGNNMLDAAIGHAGVSGNSGSSGGDGSLGQMWRYNAGHEIPTMSTTSGRFECYRQLQQHDPHCMVMFQQEAGVDLGGFVDGTSWIAGDAYTKKTRIGFPDAPVQYDVDWIVLDQLQGNAFVGPQVGWYLRNGQFEVRQLSTYTPIDVVLEQGRFYDFRWDIVLSDVNGAAVTRLYVDRVEVYHTTTANHVPGNLQNTVGNYATDDGKKESTVLIDSYELWHQAA